MKKSKILLSRIRSRHRIAEKKRNRFHSLKKLRNIARNGTPGSKVKQFVTGSYTRSVKNRLKHIKAPDNFSFIENTEEMVQFISEIQKQFWKKRGVFIIMDQVLRIDHGAIVVLLSIMVKFKEGRIEFNGSFPQNNAAKKIVKASGFIESLYNKSKSGQFFVPGRNNRILTTGWTNVSSELSLEIMKDITPKIFNEKRILKGLHKVLIELMQNSHNHANLNEMGTKEWWLSVNTENELAKFSYIDYGVGIFESLKNKKEDHVFKKWYNKAASVFKDNAKVLKRILDGEMHQTSTNQYFRGKGLPAIMEVYQRNYIKSLHIITNDVFVSVENGIYKTMDIDFNGTFVYWEINKESVTHPWTE